MLCSFGCGQESILQLKNGKFCCSISINKCPEMKRRNSSSNKNKSRPCSFKGKRLKIYETKSHPMKGKTYDEFFGLEKTQEIKSKISNSLIGVCHPVTSETKLKISQSMLKNKRSGGYRIGSGIGKKGWYKGFWCDSSYELAWIIYHLEHNIEFERNTKKFSYIFENRTYNYIPDFKLSDGSYLEVKGFRSARTEEKTKQFPEKLQVLYLEDMRYIFDYVISKHGKDFIKLYNGSVTELV